VTSQGVMSLGMMLQGGDEDDANAECAGKLRRGKLHSAEYAENYVRVAVMTSRGNSGCRARSLLRAILTMYINTLPFVQTTFSSYASFPSYSSSTRSILFIYYIILCIVLYYIIFYFILFYDSKSAKSNM